MVSIKSLALLAVGLLPVVMAVAIPPADTEIQPISEPVSSPGLVERGAEQWCSTSKEEPTRFDTASFLPDCIALVSWLERTNFAHVSSWTFPRNSMQKARPLLSYRSCSVSGSASKDSSARVGIKDLYTVLKNAVNKYAVGGRVSANGYMWCNAPAGKLIHLNFSWVIWMPTEVHWDNHARVHNVDGSVRDSYAV